MNIKKRIPFLFLEFTRLSVKDFKLIATQKEEDSEIDPSNFAAIVLGKGCSITSDASQMLSKSRTQLIFSGYKMSSVHLYSTNNLKGNLRTRQYEYTKSNRKRLSMAKKLIRFKNKELPGYLPRLRFPIKDFNDLLIKEAVWTKDAYKRTARHGGQIWLGRKDAVKGRHKMFLVNKLLYSLAIIAITGLGLDPNLGIIHNKSSGFGLALDLADVFKPSVSWDQSIARQYDEQMVLGSINEKAVLNKMIRILEDLFE